MTPPIIISIAGDSGVGKTTMAKIFSLILGPQNCTILRGDDLHKYPRNSDKWKEYTHLNPEANNLDIGDEHLVQLYNNKKILRSFYNHTTGYFDPPVEVLPNRYIIDDGLHSLYTPTALKLSNIKIYIEAPDELIKHWKISRDIKERGHSLEQVLDSIERRRADSEKFIKPQKKNSDVVVRFKLNKPIVDVKDTNEVADVSIEYYVINDFKFKKLFHHMFENLSKYTDFLNEFVVACKKIGDDKCLSQGPGGNLSAKIDDDIMLVKSSGEALKSVYHSHGYSCVLFNYINDIYYSSNETIDDEKMVDTIRAATVTGDARASMESVFHSMLSKFVIHTHPVYLNCILCSSNPRAVVREIFDGMKYKYIPFALPGSELSNFFLEHSVDDNVIFLENHGLIVSGDNMSECIQKTYTINEACKKYLSSKISGMIPFDQYSNTEIKPPYEYLYADDVMFLQDYSKPYQKDVALAHNYIIDIIEKYSTVRYLTKAEVEKIMSLSSEKYRKTV